MSSDPVPIATGILMERYHQDLEQASVMLLDLSGSRRQDVTECASWLVGTSPDPLGDMTGRDLPAVMRRAVEFIHSNARRAIDLYEIAEAAGIGERGLQAGFRKHLDQTPMGYLRNVRLQGAHRDLVAGDPARGDTVAGIAQGWGFTHPGRFSALYRHAFADSPSATLRGWPVA